MKKKKENKSTTQWNTKGYKQAIQRKNRFQTFEKIPNFIINCKLK